MTLLDTHALLFLGIAPERLSKPAARAIRRAARAGGLAVASISLWEIAMLAAAGRLRIRGTVESWLQDLLERTGVATREITPAIAALAVQFPDGFPRDPADRLIAATARAEGLALITRDEAIRESGLVETIW